MYLRVLRDADIDFNGTWLVIKIGAVYVPAKSKFVSTP